MRVFWHEKSAILMKSTRVVTLLSFALSLLVSSILPVGMVGAAEFNLPAPQQLIPLSSTHDGVRLVGLRLDPQNPLCLEFMVNKGSQEKITKQELMRLVNYFLAGLTIPKKELWVNLSPYEADRIIDDTLEITDIGQGLLFQDYMLKQLSSSVVHPETKLGSEYWQEVYSGLKSADTPVNTFNKIWISPKKAEVYEDTKTNSVFITNASLKVQLEQDYLALNSNKKQGQDASSKAMRDIIIPRIAKDVNSGRNFIQLRQIYSSLILAEWFKKKFAASFYQHCIDKGYVSGVKISDKTAKDEVYSRYCQSFRDGVYNFIRKENIAGDKRRVRKQYFSGGIEASTMEIVSFSSGIKAGDLLAGVDGTLKMRIQGPRISAQEGGILSSSLTKEEQAVRDVLIELSKKSANYSRVKTQFGEWHIPDVVRKVEEKLGYEMGGQKVLETAYSLRLPVHLIFNENSNRKEHLWRESSKEVNHGFVLIKPVYKDDFKESFKKAAKKLCDSNPDIKEMFNNQQWSKVIQDSRVVQAFWKSIGNFELYSNVHYKATKMFLDAIADYLLGDIALATRRSIEGHLNVHGRVIEEIPIASQAQQVKTGEGSSSIRQGGIDLMDVEIKGVSSAIFNGFAINSPEEFENFKAEFISFKPVEGSLALLD